MYCRNWMIALLFLALVAAEAYSQGKIVTGRVVDEQGENVIGATVRLVSNSQLGTITDAEGSFSLYVTGLQRIIVSYVGYIKQELDVRDGMVIRLVSESKMLDEVVITGMQKMDKRIFTGATTKLDASKTKLDGMADVSRALEGKAAGVSVQQVSGTFGTAPKIRVRGATSIYGSSKPLWVVDGVVMEDVVEISADQLSSGNAVTLISSAIAGLNADDIESFQILKDGSATSIYGARAMAGVIVITTKKGKSGRSTINYTGEFSTRFKPSYSDFNISNSQEQMGIYREMYDKGWLELSSLATWSSSGVYGRMFQLINTYNAETGTFEIENTEIGRNAYLREAEFRNTDWFDLLFSSNVTQNHAVSMSAGTEKARFYASLSIMDDPGWTLSSDVQRYTANANASFQVSPKFTLNLITNGSYRNQQAPGSLSRDVDVVSGKIKRNFDINPYSFAMNASRTLQPQAMYTQNFAPFNIFKELEQNNIHLSIADVKFQSELQWKPFKKLEVSALSAIRYQTTSQKHAITQYSNQAQAYRAGVLPENSTIRSLNPFLYSDPDKPNDLPQTVLPEGGIMFTNNYSVRQLDLRATFSYNSDFGKHADFIANVFGGMEMNSTDRNAFFSELWGWNQGNVPNTSPLLFKQKAEENSVYFGDSWTYGQSLAYFTSGTLSYQGKYIVNLTGRHEGTNKLGKSVTARWLPTWNVALAWNAHEELFFSKLKPAFSHFTLKSSYSLTADRGPSNVSNAEAIFRSFTPFRPFASVRETGFTLSELANSELTYEKKYEWNLGIEMGFLKNKINIVADVYLRDNFDLIGLIYTQGVGGKTEKMANVASMKSSGIELTISTKNVATKTFSWHTDLTFSKTQNTITSLEAQSNVIQLVSGEGFALKGYPVRALFSIPFQGLNNEGLPTFINQDNEYTVTDIYFQEFEKIDFLQYEGPTDPTITGGFGNVWMYKNLKLNVFLTYSFGNKLRLPPIFNARYSDLDAMPKEFRNRWVMPGDEDFTTIPVIASKRQHNAYGNDIAYAYNAYNFSTARVADGGFIRLKEISISYDLNEKLVSALKLSSLQLKLQATNLWLLYADARLNGQDPEFMNSGGVAVPLPRQITFTLRAGI